jgi:hypothetical protein
LTRFANLSVEPGGGSRAEFGELVNRKIVKYDKPVKQLVIQLG